jgi:pyruvate ferredoxin oxidoreductase alpha subunit
LECLYTEDAETIFVVQGSFAETISVAVEELRAQGEKVGLMMVRLWRPFPFKQFRDAIRGTKNLIVIDRAISFGGQGGPLAIELRSALFGTGIGPKVMNYIAGLASRDVTVADFRNMYRMARERFSSSIFQEDYQYYGVRSL